MKKFIGLAAIALAIAAFDAGSASAQGRGYSSGRSAAYGNSVGGRPGRVYYRRSNYGNGSNAYRSNDRFGYGYPYGYPPTGYGFNQINFANPGYSFWNGGYYGPPYGGYSSGFISNPANRGTYFRR